MWISKKEYEKIIKDVEHLYNMIAKDTDIRPHLNYDYNFDLLMGGNEDKLKQQIEGDDLFTIAYKVERISSLNKKIKELEAKIKTLEENHKCGMRNDIGYSNMLIVKCQKLNSEKQELETEVDRLKKLSNTQLSEYNADRKKWNDNCIKLNREIIELKNKLEEKNLCKLGSETKCKWDDKIKDPYNEGKTITEKEYLKRILGYDCLEKFPFVAIHCVSENKDKEEEKEVEVKPYYFEEGYDANYPTKICTVICEYKKNGTSIGSCSCRDCTNFIKGSNDFIKCKLRPEGKQKQEPKQPERFKRDEFGVISIYNDACVCSFCIYTKQNEYSIECSHCLKNNNANEYYSSK